MPRNRARCRPREFPPAAVLHLLTLAELAFVQITLRFGDPATSCGVPGILPNCPDGLPQLIDEGRRCSTTGSRLACRLLSSAWAALARASTSMAVGLCRLSCGAGAGSAGAGASAAPRQRLPPAGLWSPVIEGGDIGLLGCAAIGGGRTPPPAARVLVRGASLRCRCSSRYRFVGRIEGTDSRPDHHVTAAMAAKTRQCWPYQALPQRRRVDCAGPCMD